jgi:hypothetical protein
MPGLVPGIHVLKPSAGKQDVDGRDKPGHDEDETMQAPLWPYAPPCN